MGTENDKEVRLRRRRGKRQESSGPGNGRQPHSRTAATVPAARRPWTAIGSTCIGGSGELVCLRPTTAARSGSVSLNGELGGKLMSGWGYSESPLVDGDKVICTPGGDKGTLAAFDKKTGKVLWRSTEVDG